MGDSARTVAVCARQELVLAARSRWTQLFAVVFGGLTLAVSSAGYVLSGGSGMQDFARTAASLMQLVLLLVPLTALVMGVVALTPDQGAAELLYSQPVRRADIMLGTLLGLFLALMSAQALGFGAAALAILLTAGDEGLASFARVGAGSAALTAVFLALAAAVSAGQLGRRRVRALAAALVLWFVLALLVDVLALGAATMLRSGDASRVLIVSVLVNPIGAVRTATLLAIEGTAAFGAASLALFRFTGGAESAMRLLLASTLLWIVLPLAWASRRLSAADIA
jgi:Cu-processing system permease protein